MTSGSLFEFATGDTVVSTDGQNIYGKYKLLYKSANFFSNQFTWIIVFVVFLVVGLILRFARNKLKESVEGKS